MVLVTDRLPVLHGGCGSTGFSPASDNVLQKGPRKEPVLSEASEPS